MCAHQIEPFTWAGDGAFTGRWVMDLAALGEDATASGECQVTLAMDELTAQNLREDELVDLEASCSSRWAALPPTASPCPSCGTITPSSRAWRRTTAPACRG